MDNDYRTEKAVEYGVEKALKNHARAEERRAKKEPLHFAEKAFLGLSFVTWIGFMILSFATESIPLFIAGTIAIVLLYFVCALYISPYIMAVVAPITWEVALYMLGLKWKAGESLTSEIKIEFLRDSVPYFLVFLVISLLIAKLYKKEYR